MITRVLSKIAGSKGQMLNFLLWIRYLWAPKRLQKVGSLYNIIDLPVSKNNTEFKGKVPSQNDVYLTHETVMEAFVHFKYGLWDSLRHLNWSQGQMYAILALWMGRHDPSQGDISVELQTLLQIILHTKDASRKNSLLETVVVPVYNQIQKMTEILDKICKLTKIHLENVTPLMQLEIGSGSDLGRKSKTKSHKVAKNRHLTKIPSSDSIYDPAYGNIVTERSTSVVAWTPVVVEPTKKVCLTRYVGSMVSKLDCLKLTRRNRKPSVTGSNTKPLPPAPCEIEEVIPTKVQSMTSVCSEIDTGHEFKGKHEVQAKPEAKSGPALEQKSDEVLSPLTSEDLKLENTQKIPKIQPRLGIPREFDESKFVKQINTVFQMVSEIDTRYADTPMKFITFSEEKPVTQLSFKGMMNIVVENGMKMRKSINCPNIYAEEESFLGSGLRQMYLETLKCSELFESLKTIFGQAQNSFGMIWT